MITDDQLEKRQMQTNLIWIMAREIAKRNKFILPMIFGSDDAAQKLIDEKIDDAIAHLDHALNIMRKLTEPEERGKKRAPAFLSFNDRENIGK